MIRRNWRELKGYAALRGKTWAHVSNADAPDTSGTGAES